MTATQNTTPITDILDKRRMAQQLEDILNTATDEDWQDGTYWYAATHSYAAGLAQQYGVDITVAAGVIAALSPQLPWSRNEIVAAEMFARGDCAGENALSLSLIGARRAGA